MGILAHENEYRSGYFMDDGMLPDAFASRSAGPSFPAEQSNPDAR